jgi:CDGSH-type Zn-finger protein
MAIEITSKPNGPLMISGDLGDLQLKDGAGNPVEFKGSKVFLCRCGASANKPFCDGQHTKIGFQAADDAAVVEA